MSNDPTEPLRRRLSSQINTSPKDRAEMEKVHGLVWDTEELTRDFIVEGFMAPLVVVIRKSDGRRGSLFFQHNPRFYYNFVESHC